MGVDTILYLFLLHRGEGTKNTIPDGEDIAKICIGLRKKAVVVNMVHVGRNDNETYKAVNTFW